MATLIVDGNEDFSGQVLENIDTIVFTNPSGIANATFNATQFDGVQIRRDVTIIGNSQSNHLIIAKADQLDASQWQFSSWSAGSDSITKRGTREISNIVGSQQRDIIFGNAGNDIIDGGAQNDRVNGDADNDRLNGGAGNDTVNGGAGIDVIESRDGEGRDRLDGGADEDSLILNRASLSSDITVDLSVAGFSNIGEGTTIANCESMQLTTGSGNDLGVGGLFADLMTGNAGNDTFSGGDGNDQLDGGLGRNVLNGGAGDDFLFSGDGATGTMAGGAGSDIAVVNFSSVTTNFAFTMRGGGGLSLSGIDTLNATMGAGNNRVTSGAGNDRLTGLGGSDVLTGRGGIDSLDGSDGNDVLIGGAGADFMFGGAGFDMLNYSKSAAVSVNLGTNTFAGGDASGDFASGIENVTGGGFADTVTGDGNANRLIGGGGRDNLDGGLGDDRLIGGAGGDALTGGLGADFFEYNATFESGVSVSARDVLEDFDAGTVGTSVDRLDIFTIDANTLAAGNQKFAFIGAAAFTANTPGQVRVGTAAGHTFVALNIDNDILAEMRIEFSQGVSVRAEDIIL